MRSWWSIFNEQGIGIERKFSSAEQGVELHSCIGIATRLGKVKKIWSVLGSCAEPSLTFVLYFGTCSVSFASLCIYLVFLSFIMCFICLPFPVTFLIWNFSSLAVFHSLSCAYFGYVISGERGEVLHWNWRKQPDERTQDRSTLFLMRGYLPSWLTLFLHSVLSLIRGKLKR